MTTSTRCNPPRTEKYFKNEAEITEWLRSRRPGAVITIEKQNNGLGQDTFRRFNYITPQVQGFVTFCLTADGEQWFQHTGGGRYGASTDYLDETTRYPGRKTLEIDGEAVAGIDEKGEGFICMARCDEGSLVEAIQWFERMGIGVIHKLSSREMIQRLREVVQS